MTEREARQYLLALITDGVARRSDVYYEYKVKDLAELALSAFGNERNRSQMRNLEQVSLSAASFADVLDFIKSQAGRDTSTGRQWRKDDFARKLHDALWEMVRQDAEGQANNIWRALPNKVTKVLENEANINRPDVARELRLRLCRAFIKHLVAHYNYQLAMTSHAH